MEGNVIQRRLTPEARVQSTAAHLAVGGGSGVGDVCNK